ncbi:acyltransferase [Trinickia caryophylli]|uniref:Peptidoglycan/LPS O-acetylase OafA/YrhL, contains acyltransferase and SGNH-hydrolase domains n=1 Tax=Trinickia caryophylli TaxID=28094 RepID=A0A1X7G2P9_TRICW|nr:acyltransferase [Trinickia caryophylli]PMS13712.1 acyltransferase [Trinickia caryophylli]TRX14205.1 acyltransferase [Trinickia caryophylli]WQE14031.1 acyltransferase [Trinickia caryophylli]SMF62892.1 Peptidoglycan/LPS O-acetylase OafA/YrhL, contains acyltransferase and SGNH-hydrolase domains [Trinickia caryophylli]GLU33481.1 acyltransferase [Trinickia caryophylli]
MSELIAPALQESEVVHPSRRIVQLDGVRAVAVLAVFLNHALGISLWMGVDLFFVLSGFLITGILLDRKSRNQSYFGYFYARRARRILPPYLMLLVLSTLLFGTGWMSQWWWYAFFATNIGQSLGVSGNPGFGPLWSLAVEEQFYLVWPIVVLFVSERTLGFVAAAGVILAPVLRAVATPFFSEFWPIYFLTPFRMDLLCAGALLCILVRRQPDLPERMKWVAWAGLFGALATLGWLHVHYPLIRDSNQPLSNAGLYSVTLVLSTSAIVLALRSRGIVTRVLSNPLLVYIGTISYTFYLVHVTFIGLMWRLDMGRYASALSALALTIVYATLSWFWIEKRLVRGGTRRSPLSVALARD